jgi:hypothetical protein
MKGSWSLLVVVTAVACSFGLTGCKTCDDLIQKMCTDLGPDDCKYWKDHGWDQKIIPGGRRVNRACGQMMDDNIYKPLLNAAKNQVKIQRGVDAKLSKVKAN